MSLTLQQRAERAAKRRNKQVAQEYPLFAQQFAVTIESQVERLQRADQQRWNACGFRRAHSGRIRKLVYLVNGRGER